jgi:hypothetical protein
MTRFLGPGFGRHYGVDLWGAADNRLMKGFEYTATTGKYHHTRISVCNRGRRVVFTAV